MKRSARFKNSEKEKLRERGLSRVSKRKGEIEREKKKRNGE